MNLFSSIILVAILASLVDAGHKTGFRPIDRDVMRLATLMTGSFSSETQAKQNPYFAHIVLHCRRIWPDKKDAIWLYVEQAEFDKPQNPYRQRIYRLSRDGRGLISKVFEIKDAKRLIGAWRDGFDAAFLTAEDIFERPGCELILKKKGQAFVGSTDGQRCVSVLRGASYATSEAEITNGRIVTWDRGWNNKGEQVWGSTNGGYKFRKVGNNNNTDGRL